MATTITSATLTATISEKISLNGQTIDSENQYVVTGITQIDKRIVTVPLTAVTLVAFSTAVAAGQFIGTNTRYVRITNKDATNFVRIRVTKAGADTFDIKLEAGKSFMMGNTSESVTANGSAFSAFVTMDNITAQADTATVDCEVFVASI